MKPIPSQFKPLLAKRRKLRAEIREALAQPPPRDLVEVFCWAIRHKTTPTPPPPKRIAAGHGRGEAGELAARIKPSHPR